MSETKKARWGEMKERILDTPELRAEYERNKREFTLTRQLLMEIDAERLRAGISKAELARRIGKAPSAVRRLFSAQGTNPTLGTVLSIAGTLGIEVMVVRSRRSKSPPNSTLKRQSRHGEATV